MRKKQIRLLAQTLLRKHQDYRLLSHAYLLCGPQWEFHHACGRVWKTGLS